MLLFQNVLDPTSGEPLLIEVVGNDYRDAHGKLLRSLDELAHRGGEAAAGSPRTTRRTSLVRYVEGTTVGAAGMPPCACCFRTV